MILETCGVAQVMLGKDVATSNKITEMIYS